MPYNIFGNNFRIIFEFPQNVYYKVNVEKDNVSQFERKGDRLYNGNILYFYTDPNDGIMKIELGMPNLFLPFGPLIIHNTCYPIAPFSNVFEEQSLRITPYTDILNGKGAPKLLQQDQICSKIKNTIGHRISFAQSSLVEDFANSPHTIISDDELGYMDDFSHIFDNPDHGDDRIRNLARQLISEDSNKVQNKIPSQWVTELEKFSRDDSQKIFNRLTNVPSTNVRRQLENLKIADREILYDYLRENIPIDIRDRMDVDEEISIEQQQQQQLYETQQQQSSLQQQQQQWEKSEDQQQLQQQYQQQQQQENEDQLMGQSKKQEDKDVTLTNQQTTNSAVASTSSNVETPLLTASAFKQRSFKADEFQFASNEDDKKKDQKEKK